MSITLRSLDSEDAQIVLQLVGLELDGRNRANILDNILNSETFQLDRKENIVSFLVGDNGWWCNYKGLEGLLLTEQDAEPLFYYLFPVWLRHFTGTFEEMAVDLIQLWKLTERKALRIIQQQIVNKFNLTYNEEERVRFVYRTLDTTLGLTLLRSRNKEITTIPRAIGVQLEDQERIEKYRSFIELCQERTFERWHSDDFQRFKNKLQNAAGIFRMDVAQIKNADTKKLGSIMQATLDRKTRLNCKNINYREDKLVIPSFYICVLDDICFDIVALKEWTDQEETNPITREPLPYADIHLIEAQYAYLVDLTNIAKEAEENRRK